MYVSFFFLLLTAFLKLNNRRRCVSSSIKFNSFFVSPFLDFISFRSLTKENEVAAGASQAIMSAGGSQLLDHFWAVVMAGSLPLSLVRYHEYKFIFKSLVAFYSYHLEMYNLLFCFTIIGKERFNCLMLQ